MKSVWTASLFPGTSIIASNQCPQRINICRREVPDGLPRAQHHSVDKYNRATFSARVCSYVSSVWAGNTCGIASRCQLFYSSRSRETLAGRFAAVIYLLNLAWDALENSARSSDRIRHKLGIATAMCDARDDIQIDCVRKTHLQIIRAGGHGPHKATVFIPRARITLIVTGVKRRPSQHEKEFVTQYWSPPQYSSPPLVLHMAKTATQ